MSEKNFNRIIFLFMILMLLVFILTANDIITTVIGVFFIIITFIGMYSNDLSAFFGKKLISKNAYYYIKNNIEFYRDVIQDYSIGELSFIFGYDIDYPKDVVAILLKLQLNKVIQITDKGISVCDGYNYKLKKSEKYVLSCIKDGHVVLPNKDCLTYLIIDEVEEDGLLKHIEFSEFKGYLFICLPIILFLIIFFLSCFTFTREFIIFNYFLAVIFFLILIFVIVGISYLINGSKYSWKLTKNGRTILTKLLGLKKYLSYFSIINKRDIKELFIWEDYLIYSVMFDLNRDIIRKYDNLVCIGDD